MTEASRFMPLVGAHCYRECPDLKAANSAIDELLEALRNASWLLADLSPDGLVKRQIDAALAKHGVNQ